MLVWFIYDISENKPRRLISQKAIELGLLRVQKSVFVGNISKSICDELMLFSRRYMNPEEDSIYFLPMCQDDFKKVTLMGLAFDKASVNRELKSMFW
ncbi:MAG: CRISPR-associated endonuclease Cas2 [Halanaerobiales bacterium]|nr:CRISPR-associated endonuclease Cas2 [Halanaerobiales bacterium]